MGTGQERLRNVGTSTALMLAVLPYGLIITVLNFVAVAHTRAALPHAPVYTNARDVGIALRQFTEFGWTRSLAVAAFFGATAVVFGVLAWLVRRGGWRWPAAVLVPTGMFSAAYVVGLCQVFLLNPVSDYRYQDLPNGGGVPWAMSEQSPVWYLPALGAVLALAALTQVVALVLLTRTGRAARAGKPVGMGAVLTARPVPLLLALAFAMIFTVANYAAIWSAENVLRGHRAGPALFRDVVEAQRDHAVVLAVALGLATVCMAVVVLWARHGGRPVAAAIAGVLSVPYALILVLSWRFRPLTPSWYPDDQSGLTAARPDWHPPVLASLLAVAALGLLGYLFSVVRAAGPGRSGPAPQNGSGTGLG